VPAWCCEPFDRLLQNAGEGGVSVVAHRDARANFRGFYLQARPFERDVADAFSQIDAKTGKVKWPELRDYKDRPVPWITAIHFLLVCCPRCGRRLDEVIQDNQDTFDTLADQHAKYMTT
jgi:hypothetical protein